MYFLYSVARRLDFIFGVEGVGWDVIFGASWGFAVKGLEVGEEVAWMLAFLGVLGGYKLGIGLVVGIWEMRERKGLGFK